MEFIVGKVCRLVNQTLEDNGLMLNPRHMLDSPKGASKHPSAQTTLQRWDPGISGYSHSPDDAEV
jgi:hypothetical protein